MDLKKWTDAIRRIGFFLKDLDEIAGLSLIKNTILIWYINHQINSVISNISFSYPKLPIFAFL